MRTVLRQWAFTTTMLLAALAVVLCTSQSVRPSTYAEVGLDCSANPAADECGGARSVDPLAVAAASAGRDCVAASSPREGVVPVSAVVSDASGVRVVTFGQAWDLAEAGKVQTERLCY